MHFHAYTMTRGDSGEWRIALAKRLSTDAGGVGQAMGLHASAKVDLQTIVAQFQAKMSDLTRFDFGPIPSPASKTEPS
jgi:hypothetical protein